MGLMKGLATKKIYGRLDRHEQAFIRHCEEQVQVEEEEPYVFTLDDDELHQETDDDE